MTAPAPAQTEAPIRRPVLVVAGAAALAVLAFLTAVTLPGPSPLTGLPVVAQLVALRGLVGLCSVAAAAGLVAAAVLLRRRLAGALVRALAAAATALALVGAIQAAVLAERGGPLPAASPWSGDGLVVLGLNTESEVSAAELADLVQARGADVVGLPETLRSVAEQAAAQLADRGLDYQVMSEVLAGGTNPSTSLLVARSVGSYQVSETGPAASFVATGTGPPLVVVHTRAPVDADLAGWALSTRYPVEQCALLPGAIVVGDFNATLDHPAFADLGSCVDAAAETGGSATGTWPATLPRALAAPIDHVLVDPAGWQVLRFTVLDPPGSADHRAVEAVLRPAARTTG